MKVTVLPNKILRNHSVDVKLPLNNEDNKLCQNMISYIINSQKFSVLDVGVIKDAVRPGIGIAAPQLGVNKRLFYVNVPATNDDDLFEELLINPIFTMKSVGKAALKGGEGCLSVEDESSATEGYVKRCLKVVVKGYSYIQKKQVTITKIGYHAIVLQHEMDHLNGMLFVDRLNKKDP